MSDNQSKPLAQESLNAPTSEEKDQNKEQSNTELIRRIPIPNTPLTFVHKEDRGFIALGNYRVSEEVKTGDQSSTTNEEMEKIGLEILILYMWDIILNMIILGISIENKRQAELKNKN